MKVVVFGAGEAGRHVIAQMPSSVRILAVCDNDAAKHGRFFAGHEIVAPSRIPSMGVDEVIVASMYWREIEAQLSGLGMPRSRVRVHPISQGGVQAPAPVAALQANTSLPLWMVPNLQPEAADLPNARPLVSVIMPTRDRATLLPRAIDSVLAQSYSEFELLVIDDGSRDGTLELLKRYIARDSRVRLLAGERLGVCAARNRGLNEARGELIAYLDSDNRWHPEFLELMVRGFRDQRRKTGYAGFNVFDLEHGRSRAVVTSFDHELMSQSSAVDLNTFMHRRELVDLHGGFLESMTRLVDWELILRYTRLHPPFVIGCALADYFQHADGARISDSEPFLANRSRMQESLSRVPRRPARRGGPLRIAYVQSQFPAISQTFVQNEIARLRDLGVEVSVFHVRDSIDRAEIPAEWTVAKFSSREELAWRLTAADVDLVHTHFAVPHPADFIIPVCERLNLPFTVKPHAYDIFRRDHHPRHHIARTATHRMCAFVYCIGQYHRSFLETEGVPSDKLMIVRNVFEWDTFWRPVHRTASRVRRVLAMSRFVEKKGFHLLVPAFRQLADPDLRLELHGYGDERQRLEELASGDSRITIHDGPRCPAEASELFRDADLFVLPCVQDRHGDTDGLPTVLMEAMAAGVPVLTTGIASTPDLVRNGETGLLVETGSVPALVEGLQRALALSADERLRLAQSAQTWLRQEFDPAINTTRLLESWNKLGPTADRTSELVLSVGS